MNNNTIPTISTTIPANSFKDTSKRRGAWLDGRTVHLWEKVQDNQDPEYGSWSPLWEAQQDYVDLTEYEAFFWMASASGVKDTKSKMTWCFLPDLVGQVFQIAGQSEDDWFTVVKVRDGSFRLSRDHLAVQLATARSLRAKGRYSEAKELIDLAGKLYC